MDNGFRVHGGNSCESMPEGGHYNATGQPHPQHVGNMPPLLENDGIRVAYLFLGLWKILSIFCKLYVIMPLRFQCKVIRDS